MTWRIENARVPGESRLVEVSVLGTTESSEEEVFDAKGKLVLPSFAELHTHLDKTYSPIPHHEGGLLGAIMLMRQYAVSKLSHKLLSELKLRCVKPAGTGLRPYAAMSTVEVTET